ncbi:hypothetical protein BJP36_38975 [Moorena producens JHB]|uniref:Uncharacterized protein n=1 Tax=Moorena producens (strain JHB) TaxID=1454205 RepID=A0A9Q9SUV3_MOOP1|nr:hypothetical protein [Moorena producens]WAN70052.1 hypothetical protein BJP36_38975 [Moorena producens JHB]
MQTKGNRDIKSCLLPLASCLLPLAFPKREYFQNSKGNTIKKQPHQNNQH